MGGTAEDNSRSVSKRVTLPIWVLVTLGFIVAAFVFLVGVSVGFRGEVPQSISTILGLSDRTTLPSPVLSQDVILQIINSSIQSGKPLYLVGANLSGANLIGADLKGADLSTSDLSNADLYEADLSGANLFGTYLSGADLRRANLSKADLRKAYLGTADLRGTNLSTANLSSLYLDGAIYTHQTSWPEDFDPASVGAVLRER